MNYVILSGNLARDFETRKTANDTTVSTNCIAVSRDYKDANGNYPSDFINIVVYGKTADYISTKASKGDRVELVGTWRVSTYETQDGKKGVKQECVVNYINIINKKKTELSDIGLPIGDIEEEEIEVKGNTDIQDDLPF